MNISLILEKVSVLKYHPEWVDGGPGLPGPVFRTAIAEYVIAGLVREVSAKVASTEFASALQQTAKELVAEAARKLTSDFAATAEDPDDICPPYPHHFPPPPPRGDSFLSEFVNRPGPTPW